ncbi:hypothetical protein MAR_028266 [Mya arenaria]|uniref:Uncharacterized protein n=1 Tax=Mya arenaria TaxID=6604 RepID=A0ABY7DF21_MYAAR|nr:hypothetical protein MAR_028266 [Mya arenaria]
MSVQAGDQSLLACIKRLLLSKQEVLQVGACHVLAQLLDPVAGETYGPQVLQSDLVGKVADLQEVFGGSVLPQSVVESYLLLLYIDLQLENRILSPEQLAALAQAIVDHQCAVDQLSPLAQKHFIYLLAYVCVAGSCNISCIISNGKRNL